MWLSAFVFQVEQLVRQPLFQVVVFENAKVFFLSLKTSINAVMVFPVLIETGQVVVAVSAVTIVLFMACCTREIIIHSVLL